MFWLKKNKQRKTTPPPTPVPQRQGSIPPYAARELDLPREYRNLTQKELAHRISNVAIVVDKYHRDGAHALYKFPYPISNDEQVPAKHFRAPAGNVTELNFVEKLEAKALRRAQRMGAVVLDEALIWQLRNAGLMDPPLAPKDAAPPVRRSYDYANWRS